jgi:uncharacterized protein (DUF58 family)
MIPVDILQKIRRIHITTKRLAANVFAGEYKSAFKGRGLEFDEVREYIIGDDIRFIDWNITARTGSPHIKKFVEEREQSIMILLDASRSGYFGSTDKLKKEIAAEISAVLAASAAKNNDRAGLIVFTDRIEKFVPPRKGRNHILRIIREALYFSPKGRRTDIPMAIDYLNNMTTRRSIAFLVSDFYASEIKRPLSLANQRHDVIAVRITDPRDFIMPNAGIIALVDRESGKRYLVDTTRRSVREGYASQAEKRSRELKDMFLSLGIDSIDISTAKPYTEALIQFFKKRTARRGPRG